MRYVYRTALIASALGFMASLGLTMAALFGIRLPYWFALFGLGCVLAVPYTLACDAVVHGGATGWWKNPSEHVAPPTVRQSLFQFDFFFKNQRRWFAAFSRRPRWMKILDVLVTAYALLTWIPVIVARPELQLHTLTAIDDAAEVRR